MVPNLAHHLRLMLVTDDRLLAGRDLVQICRLAVRGGVTSIQLRLKQATARDMLAQARRMAAGVEVPIIVNDRPDVAAACKSWVHLGSADVPLSFARAVLQADQVIGASVGSRGEARSAQAADYWGIGPWRATTTKADAGPPLGASGFRRLVSLSPTRCCIAIGGLIPEDGPLVLRMGGAGLAVASGILGGHDIEGAARRYAERLEAATEGC